MLLVAKANKSQNGEPKTTVTGRGRAGKEVQGTMPPLRNTAGRAALTCGTQRGETKLVASTVMTPASASRSISPTLTSVGTICGRMGKWRGDGEAERRG